MSNHNTNYIMFQNSNPLIHRLVATNILKNLETLEELKTFRLVCTDWSEEGRLRLQNHPEGLVTIQTQNGLSIFVQLLQNSKGPFCANYVLGEDTEGTEQLTQNFLALIGTTNVASLSMHFKNVGKSAGRILRDILTSRFLHLQEFHLTWYLEEEEGLFPDGQIIPIPNLKILELNIRSKEDKNRDDAFARELAALDGGQKPFRKFQNQVKMYRSNSSRQEHKVKFAQVASDLSRAAAGSLEVFLADQELVKKWFFETAVFDPGFSQLPNLRQFPCRFEDWTEIQINALAAKQFPLSYLYLQVAAEVTPEVVFALFEIIAPTLTILNLEFRSDQGFTLQPRILQICDSMHLLYKLKDVHVQGWQGPIESFQKYHPILEKLALGSFPTSSLQIPEENGNENAVPSHGLTTLSLTHEDDQLTPDAFRSLAKLFPRVEHLTLSQTADSFIQFAILSSFPKLEILSTKFSAGSANATREDIRHRLFLEAMCRRIEFPPGWENVLNNPNCN